VCIILVRCDPCGRGLARSKRYQNRVSFGIGCVDIAQTSILFLLPLSTTAMADTVELRLSDFLLPDGADILHLSKVHKLRPGDHLLVRFKLPIPENSNLTSSSAVTIDAWHHGIFTGMKEEDLWVIDMGPTDPAALTNPFRNVPANIQERTLADFVGRETHLAVYHYPNTIDTPEHRTMVLKRAWDMLHADPESQPYYNILLSDCDAFAVYCWTGRYVKDRSRLAGHVLAHHLYSKPCSKLLGVPERKPSYSSRQL
jgi:hypothetical protein